MRQKTEAQFAVTELQKHIEKIQEGAAAQQAMVKQALDAVTGLPGREPADAAFPEALATPGRKYMVLAVMDRLSAVNARFGHAVGDQMMRALR